MANNTMKNQNNNETQSVVIPSSSWFVNGAEYRERDGYVEARNHLNPEWVIVDKADKSEKEQYTYKITIDDSQCAYEYEYVCDGSYAIRDIAEHIHSLLKAENELEGKYVEQ